MRNDVLVNHTIVIPDHEIELTASRSGGPGGQHVNRTESRITLRWNVKTTSALNDEQKARVLHNLQAQLTIDGDVIIHQSAARSQQQNKGAALERLAQMVRKALYVPKKRMATRVTKAAKEVRLQAKKQRSLIKSMRSKIQYD